MTKLLEQYRTTYSATADEEISLEDYLALVSAGSSYAVGVWNGFSWEGRWAWKWKDRIDRAFVARYR